VTTLRKEPLTEFLFTLNNSQPTQVTIFDGVGGLVAGGFVTRLVEPSMISRGTEIG